MVLGAVPSGRPRDPFADPAHTFDLGPVGMLTVTPQGGTSGQVIATSGPFTNSATFLLTAPIPEPASGLLIAAACGLLLARPRTR